MGASFVGLATALVYARQGYFVTGIDVDAAKVDLLKAGTPPFHEPGIAHELRRALRTGRLSFSTDAPAAIAQSTVVIVCVGTPSAADGTLDTTALWAALQQIRDTTSQPGLIAVLKSTVPLGFFREANTFLATAAQRISLASMPEFLREGAALEDAIHPEMVLIGSDDRATLARLAQLNKRFGQKRIVEMSGEAAVLVKYANNAHGAMRIVFVNELAELSEHFGGSIDEVVRGLHFSKTVNDFPFYPGIGYGGSCFPKDVRAIAAQSRQFRADDLFTHLDTLNTARPRILLDRLAADLAGGWDGRTVAVLGLSFKPESDDQREAPAATVIPYLLEHGAQVRAYDPVVTEFADATARNDPHFAQCASLQAAIADAEVVIPLIEWPEIVGFDFAKVPAAHGKLFADLRNQFSPHRLLPAGWTYRGVGR